ncbi:MAG: hypothetical protein ABI969_03310 [bacterium]
MSVPRVRLVKKASQPKPDEAALIDSIVSLHTTGGNAVRALLEDRWARLESSPNAVERGLLQRLQEVRSAGAPVKGGDAIYPATVAVVDQLSDQSADAVVIRRQGMLPHDVIMLGRGKMTTEALGAGITALFALRDQEGDLPTRDMRLVVHGGRAPKHWAKSAQGNRASADISQLRSSARRQVQGLGAVQAVDIPLEGSRRKTP